MLIDQSIARVRAYRQAKGWSILRLAKEAGLGESTIRRLDSPDWCPTAGTLRQLESVIPADFTPVDTVEQPADAA
ncbi:helix-turn-helix transcriptional regulator [Niveispirillum sp.]|uniref:helix-turn-helix domain-containing protein n=1 Tax=Niveispirillum sp. TaxID=1917217 RepID=UPI001B775CCE|nr:helix-turn-helix transcriptional regulator [Niveispirillum sp.]MBP7337691.1 helix-turn-helix transcriptional regulator [Niveispirillum sp.]